MDTKQPLVVIVGPTASGKSDVAMQIALKYGGEIVCADSRTVYRGMDIGTAKPSNEDQKAVPHHLLDVVEPGRRFTVADFQKLANEAIADIKKRRKLPLLVGGTGLYIDSVVLDYEFTVDHDAKLRETLENMTLSELYDYCKINNIKLPVNYKNKRHVVRNIERKNNIPRSNDNNLSTSIIVGIATEKEDLRSRIVQRSEHIFENGVAEEAKELGKKYGWENEAMTGNIYPILHKYILEDISLEQAKEQFIVADWRLAKRQMTWLKRHKFIHWASKEDAVSYIDSQLALAKSEQK